MAWSNEVSEYPYVLSGFSEDIINQRYKRIEYTDSTSKYISEDNLVTIDEIWNDDHWLFTILTPNNKSGWTSMNSTYEDNSTDEVNRIPLEETHLSAEGVWFNDDTGE
jgi:hypothetical protein